MIQNDCNNDSLSKLFKVEWSFLNIEDQVEWHAACCFLMLNKSVCFCWLVACWTLLKIHLTLKLRSPVGLEEQKRSLQRNGEANMAIRRRRLNAGAETETSRPDCKMLQALLECEKFMQASGNRFDGRLGTGEGFTISCVRKPNRKFSPKCLLVKLDLRCKKNVEWPTMEPK